MKRMMAVLLTGCLAFQTWLGASAPVYSAEIPAETENMASPVMDETLPDETEPDEAVPDETELDETAPNTQTDEVLPEEPDSETPSSEELLPEETSSDETEPEKDAGEPLEEETSLPETSSLEAREPVDEGTENTGANASTQAQSALEVEIRPSYLFPYKGNVTVKVSDSSKTTQLTKQLDFTGSEPSSLTARFDVPVGDYTVSLLSDRFATYSQNIRVTNGWISKILVYSTKIETGCSAVPGWFRPGDANRDGIINQADADALLNAIRKDPQGTDMDLNNDGKTDIVDLQYVVQSLDERRESQVTKLGLTKKTQAVNGTSAEGDMQDFLNGEGSISLKPSDTDSEISENNPVGMEFVLAEENSQGTPLRGMTILAPTETDADGNVSNEITAGTAEVSYVDETGTEQTLEFPLSSGQAQTASKGRMAARAPLSENASVSVDADGSLVLDFGTQIAVKRVTIKITGTKKTEPLVNIAKVEFVNNMEERIPAPQLDIPTPNTPISENEGLTVSWTPQRNVTGYEVFVEGPVKKQSGTLSQIVRVSGTQHRISSINDNPLKNFAEYKIKVRSVNGDWRSPWSKEVIGIPKPQKLPAPPDNVTATGGFCSITVSWKDMDDANGYMVYYKKKADPDTAYLPVVSGFQPVQAGTGKLDGTRHVITGLEKDTQYSVYVIGWNELGWGKPSLVSVASTTNTDPPQLPKYGLINTSNGTGKVSAHIAAAAYGGSGGACMMGSPLDTEPRSALGLVDDDYGSYWFKADWDDGPAYPARDKGMTVTLDADYKMGYMTFSAADITSPAQYATIDYWNSENPNQQQSVATRMLRKIDVNNHPYYIIKFAESITANKIRLCIGKASGARDLRVGEIHFHHYDSLDDDIMGLYEDEMHTTLKAEVTEDTINTLEERLNTPDPATDEKHPLFAELALEIKTAREILAANLAPAYEVDNRITGRKDSHLGFGGLNAWQPLGKTAYMGETLLVYVGHNTLRTGQNASLQLVFTQYHAEASTLARAVNLKVGRNEITVPQITTKDFERGGQLYIAYTGNNPSDKYAVRISGGSDIPALNVFKKSGAERTEAIRTYITDLQNYVGTIQTKHNDLHTGTKNVDYDYDQTNCILNSTDIMMDQMMYSLPATQIWAGIQNATDKVTKLDNALRAMEDTMTLFYQHKGLSDSAGTDRGNNALPAQHLNIRYMRMFAGAFMYASGNHIGIEWGSTVLTPDSWNGLGWGIAHEIGHDINQGTYAVAEVTNNYFAMLLTGTQRFTYENVYKKVTSGTIGRAPNVFTQLALYWQLHLAFDDNTDDRHIFTDYEEQFNSLFFARVDTYSRNPAKAPQAGLTLNGGSEQNLMRLSCAAANRNILPFFRRWGMVPDADTIAYAEKYGAEDTKALYYINQDARSYRVTHPDEAGTIKDQDAVSAAVTANANRAEVTISTSKDADLILGYEISRSMIFNGEKKTEIVGFQPINTAQSTVYTDTISSINNRVMEYEVRAVDKFLNYSNIVSAGSVKIQTDGVLDKSLWSVETTMTSTDDTAIEPDADDPDSGYNEQNPSGVTAQTHHTIDRILDNDKTDNGTYHGTSGGNASITVDMCKTEQVTSLKYHGDALEKVTVEVSSDGTAWTAVKTDYTGLNGAEERMIWFDSVEEASRTDWIGTYDARYVRLTIPQTGDISIKEIEICGPTGDNLEFMSTDSGQPAIGVSTADFKYGNQTDDIIPAGSLIFTGTYKGNPAYNLVVLYDTEGNVIGEKDGNVSAKQVILANVPEHGNLGETSAGTWVYYVEPGQWSEDSLKKLSGVRGELFRVDNALTLEGERIVSDTPVISIPDSLPDITLTGGIVPGN